MTYKRIILLLILTTIGLVLLPAQEKTVKGRVFTFDSIPLAGVDITVKSSGEVYYSDSTGSFSVICKSKDLLKAKAWGFSTHRIRIKNPVRYVVVNMKLKPGPENQELAIGYGHIKDIDKLHAISQVHEDDLKYGHYTDVHEILNANFPEVNVDANGNVHIRGFSSVGGNNSALIILDGVEIPPSSLSSVSPNVIGTINILKDASAAIYGARGGNGVVIIETKRGQKK